MAQRSALDCLIRPSAPGVVAHRGARNLAPENTVEAVRAALGLAVRAVEFDVDVSSDGVPIVIHQETLEPDSTGRSLRLAGADLTRAWTLAMSYERISGLDAGRWHAPAFAGAKVPRLEQLLSLEWGDRMALVELKDPFFWSDPAKGDSAFRICDAALPSVQSFVGRGARAALLSFSPYILEICKERLPEVPRIYAVWTDKRGDLDGVLREARALEASAVTMPDFVAIEDRPWVEKIHDLGIQAQVYEVSPDAHGEPGAWTAEKRRPIWEALVRAKVDTITSDFPDQLLEFLE